MKNKKLMFGLLALSIGALIPLTTQSKSSSTDNIVVTSNNLIVLNEAVTGESVSAVLIKAKELDTKYFRLPFSKEKPIYLFLNTPGGSIQAGLELIEGLQALKRPVHTITLFAASMGFQIAQNMGDRLILKNGVLMSHRAGGEFRGEFGGSRPSQLDSRYDFWLSRLNEMDQQTVNRTNGKQTLETYQKAYATEMWRTGNQSTKEGYADRVVKVSCDKSVSGATTHEVSFFGMIIKYDLDNCPMNTAPTNIRAFVNTNKGLKQISELTQNSSGFGYACLEASVKNVNQVCATDVNITLERVVQAKEEFKTYYEATSHQVIRMQIGK